MHLARGDYPRLRVIQGGKATSTNDGQQFGEMVALVRARLGINHDFPDEAIEAALQDIAAAPTAESRWQAAWRSNLGLVLSLRIGDLSGALEFLIDMVARSGVVAAT